MALVGLLLLFATMMGVMFGANAQPFFWIGGLGLCFLLAAGIDAIK